MELIELLESGNYRILPKDRADLLSTDVGGVACEVFSQNDLASVLLWLPKYTGSPRDMGVLAHEICHVKNFIFIHVGQRADEKNDEAETHLVEYLTKTFATWRKNQYRHL